MLASDPPGLRQFNAWFRLDDNGVPVTVAQDSPEEIGAAILNIVACVQGGKLGDPQFGIPSPLFQNVPINLAEVLAAIRRLEPRADLTGAQALSRLQRVTETIAGRLLPGQTLPGRVYPSAGTIESVVSGGVDSVNVTIDATVTGNATSEPQLPALPLEPDNELFPADNLFP